MSDERLRELERRWKETGSVEDEAKYLLERVRVGNLEQEKLELAAYCGHPGARAALKRPQRADDELFHAWLLELHKRHGFEPALRASVLTGQLLLPLWEEEYPEDDRPRAAIEAADRRAAGHGGGNRPLSNFADAANDASVEAEASPGGATLAAAVAAAVADFAAGALGDLETVAEMSACAANLGTTRACTDLDMLQRVVADKVAQWALSG